MLLADAPDLLAGLEIMMHPYAVSGRAKSRLSNTKESLIQALHKPGYDELGRSAFIACL
jgi:hypothetical protein